MGSRPGFTTAVCSPQHTPTPSSALTPGCRPMFGCCMHVSEGRKEYEAKASHEAVLRKQREAPSFRGFHAQEVASKDRSDVGTPERLPSTDSGKPGHTHSMEDDVASILHVIPCQLSLPTSIVVHVSKFGGEDTEVVLGLQRPECHSNPK
ncbi:hypothetical protein P7K49_000102 [Saguinus oedipus]|uniref:Uncharacterized protein n=1 Tax=Saguinus oedipus TaxID=9490 RepID=A0ABQ9WBK4_SAGOE|nr:hypothetical protein P7K49_000102 [Saguinus oedipus]